MSTPAQGMYAALYLGGTLVGLLTGVDFNWTKPIGEFAEMGTHIVTAAFSGVSHFSGAFRKAYVDNTFLNHFNSSNPTFVGSLVPRTGKSIVGTLILTGGSLSNMEHEETAAIIEEGTFIMHTMTFS